MITYRKATENDCYAIAELKGKVWNTTYQGIYSQKTLDNYDISKNQRIMEQIVKNPEIEVYVATDAERIVGFMTCGKPYKPFQDFQQEIGMLYILKEYQRRGIGRQFLELARRQAVENGHGKICVAVNRKNYDAQRFYLAMGGSVLCTDESQIHLCFLP